jgi:tRNA(Ile)-lysidine synthetase-like protein
MIKYEHIYKFWKDNKQFWFSATPDDNLFIYNIFKNDIHELIAHGIQTLPSHSKLTFEQCIGLIILLDQLPRNLKYILNIQKCDLDQFSKKAMHYARELLDLIDYTTLSAFDFIFIHLPTRHVGSISEIQDVGCISFKVLDFFCQNSNAENDVLLIRKFINATFNRISLKQDSIVTVTYPNVNHKKNNWDYSMFTNVCETKYNKCLASTSIDTSLNYVINTFKDYVTQHKVKNIIVSLSGGVDSMLCLYICSLCINVENIVAVHINYSNRTETKHEQDFVELWCKDYSHVRCFSRAIVEINRPQCMRHGLRELYETYTRNVRFACYDYALQSMNASKDDTIVILGHNKDDAFENIITNIKAIEKLDNLAGFDYESQCTNGLKFIRPLLRMSKDHIFDVAHALNIPYLKDTTVRWANRFKVRNTIAPAIKNFEAYESFHSHADSCRELCAIIDYFVYSSVVTIKSTGKLICSLSHPLLCKQIFAQKLFKEVYNVYFTRKSIHNFMDRMSRVKCNKIMTINQVVLDKTHCLSFKLLSSDNVEMIF